MLSRAWRARRALAALPGLCGIASATPALAVTARQPGHVPKATDDLVRNVERRHNAPLLAPGTHLLLPAGVRAVHAQDYYRHPHLASAQSDWPHMTATDGTKVDASIAPERGAATGRKWSNSPARRATGFLRRTPIP